METSGPTSGVPKTVTTGNPASSAKQWQVGQLLQATVAQSDIGKVLLSIGNRQVSAQTSLPLQAGQQLALQVRSLGEQPLLRIMTNLSAPSPLADAVRMLLPRQATLPPLLASLAQLAKDSKSPLPAQISELVKTLVKQQPDARSLGTQAGLKEALRNSGVFLEGRLAQAAQGSSAGPQLQTDFKAGLLRLIQALRDWPAADGQPASSAAKLQQASTPPSTAASSPAQTTHPAASTPGRSDQLSAPAPAPGSGQTASPGAQPASPQQLGRAIGTVATAGVPTTKPGPAPGSNATVAASSGGVASGRDTPVPAAATATPPPFRGSVPQPQATVESTLDLINRLGNLRLDLLQQAEAAVARIQLHQLAALPREGERGLLEWLFELPLRRGDELDLWSLRLYREADARAHQADRKQAEWSMQLAFELPGLGPVQALVQLTGETVSTRFWAQDPNTVPLFNQHLDELRRALLDAGLDVADLDCLPGSIQPRNPPPHENFISEKA